MDRKRKSVFSSHLTDGKPVGKIKVNDVTGFQDLLAHH
jgi:hypothetical protein